MAKAPVPPPKGDKAACKGKASCEAKAAPKKGNLAPPFTKKK